MPTRCKKGTRRYPPKTGTCMPKSEIPKKTRLTKKTKSIINSTSINPRCPNGTRRHPPKIGFCIEKHLIGKKKMVYTPILSSHSKKSSNSVKSTQLVNELIYEWEIDNNLSSGELDNSDKDKIRSIVTNNPGKSKRELYNLITDEFSDNYGLY